MFATVHWKHLISIFSLLLVTAFVEMYSITCEFPIGRLHKIAETRVFKNAISQWLRQRLLTEEPTIHFICTEADFYLTIELNCVASYLCIAVVIDFVTIIGYKRQKLKIGTT